jgi:hypothetical protein
MGRRLTEKTIALKTLETCGLPTTRNTYRQSSTQALPASRAPAIRQ